jgi:hypothetical protein
MELILPSNLVATDQPLITIFGKVVSQKENGGSWGGERAEEMGRSQFWCSIAHYSSDS